MLKRLHHRHPSRFDREVMTDPFVTLLDTTTQWIFNKSALYGPLNGAGKNPEKASTCNW